MFDTHVIVKRMNRFTQSGIWKKTKEDIHKSIADHKTLVKAAGASQGKVGPRYYNIDSAAMKPKDATNTRSERQTGEGESRPGTRCQTGQGDSQPDVTVETTGTTITTTTTTGTTSQHHDWCQLLTTLSKAPTDVVDSKRNCRTTASAAPSGSLTDCGNVSRPAHSPREAIPVVSTCPQQSVPMQNASVQNSTTGTQKTEPASQRALTLLSDDARKSTA